MPRGVRAAAGLEGPTSWLLRSAPEGDRMDRVAGNVEWYEPLLVWVAVLLLTVPLTAAVVDAAWPFLVRATLATKVDMAAAAISSIAAVGTWAAVWAALHGLRETRAMQRDEATARAAFAAAGIAGTVGALYDAARFATGQLDFIDPNDNTSDLYAEVLGLLELEAYPVPYDVLQALLPLPDHTAGRIARALGLMEQVRRHVSIARSATSWRDLRPSDRSRITEQWSKDLQAAVDLLTVASAACHSAAERAAPFPSGEELYGD